MPPGVSCCHSSSRKKQSQLQHWHFNMCYRGKLQAPHQVFSDMTATSQLLAGFVGHAGISGFYFVTIEGFKPKKSSDQICISDILQVSQIHFRVQLMKS